MLLERIDELPLRHHDLRGNPSALLGAIVAADRPAQGRADHRRATTPPGPRRSPTSRGRRARAAREREFAELYARPRPHARRGRARSTSATSCCTRSALLREKPHVRARLAARYRHVLVDELQDTSFAQGLLLRLLVAEHGNVTAVGRRRPGDPPLPRRGDEEHRATSGPSGRRRRVVRAGASSFRCPARGCCGAARAVVAPIEDRLEKRAAPPAATRAARSRSGAARTSARRRRPSPPTSSG